MVMRAVFLNRLTVTKPIKYFETASPRLLLVMHDEAGAIRQNEYNAYSESRIIMMKKRILDAISKNSRYDIEDLAAMLGTDEETVAQEIKEMEEQKIICGYPTLINWDNTDHEKVTALIEVKVTPQRDMGFHKVAERIYKFEEVESVYLMSGGVDLTVIIEGKSMKEVSRFVSEKLSTLENVTSTATYFVLKKYKEHGLAMTDSRKKEERMLITP